MRIDRKPAARQNVSEFGKPVEQCFGGLSDGGCRLEIERELPQAGSVSCDGIEEDVDRHGRRLKNFSAKARRVQNQAIT